MSSDQAESSTAQSRKAAFHLATFVFDSGSLPLESYIKLIEHDGVIHKLVQRLMEKHPNNDSVSLPTRPLRRRNPKLTNSQLRLGILITPAPGIACIKNRHHTLDYQTPSAFLTSLPKLAPRFSKEGSGYRSNIRWPAFDAEEPIDDDKKNISYLLSGIVGGIEVGELFQKTSDGSFLIYLHISLRHSHRHLPGLISRLLQAGSYLTLCTNNWRFRQKRCRDRNRPVI
jgi:hypothetical protein